MQANSKTATITSILLRSIEVWLVISVAETIHGVARRALLEPFVGDFAARQIGVVTGSAIIMAIVFLFRHWIGATRVYDCVVVGTTWVVLTLGFELFLGRVVLGLGWDRILSDYDIVRGGLMPLGLLVMFLAPLIVRHLSVIRQTDLNVPS